MACILSLSACLLAQSKPEVLYSADTDKGAACYRIPSLITAGNGDLVAAVDQRNPSCSDLRSNRDINISIRRSADNGKSWTEMKNVIDYPDGQSASDPSMILDKTTGELFLFFNFMDVNKEPDVYYLKVCTSKDHGKTWTQPIDITQQISPGWDRDFKFITSGRGYQTRSGDLIHTVVNLSKGLHLFRSKDHGLSWALLPTPISPGDESKFVELENGDWIVNSRANGTGLRYHHKSTDQGVTWTSWADFTLRDPGCNASLLLANNSSDSYSILFISHLDSPKERKNLVIRTSYDQGKSWPLIYSVHEGSAAYSSMTQLKDGSIGILFERNNYSEIVFQSFTLESLLAK